jgi:hypothetical protein
MSDEFTFEDAMNLRRPKPELQLSGEDGNAFFMISRGRLALQRAGYSDAEVQEFTDEAESGDYDNVLQTMFKWFNVL